MLSSLFTNINFRAIFEGKFLLECFQAIRGRRASKR